MRSRALLATGVVLVATAAMTACDSSGRSDPDEPSGPTEPSASTDPTGPPTGSLEHALSVVPGTEENLDLITYTDISAAAELGAYESADSPFATAGQLGYGDLSPLTGQLEPLLPDPATDGSWAVSVGQAPSTAFRFDGVDGSAVEEFFAAADGERSELGSGTLLVRRADAETDLQDDLLPPQVLASMNTVWFEDQSLIGSSHQARVSELADRSGDSAGDAAAYQGVSTCLGEVVAAHLQAADIAAAVSHVAVGYAGTEDEPEATLCLRAPDGAEDLASQLGDAFSSGNDPRTGQPLTELLGDVTVAVADGGWVQARTSTAEHPDVFLQLVTNTSLGELVG